MYYTIPNYWHLVWQTYKVYVYYVKGGSSVTLGVVIMVCGG